MKNLLLWWGINAISLYVVASILPGVEVADGLGTLLLVALVIGLVNAILRPILYFVSCGLIILTLGLVIPVLNAILLLLADRLIGDEFEIESFLWALIAAILMGLINTALHQIVEPKKKEEKQHVQ